MFRKIKKLSISTIAIILILTGFGAFTSARLFRSQIINGLFSSTKIESTINNIPSDYELFAPRFNYINTSLFVLSGLINSNQVMLGKDEWLFYSSENDGNPIDDYMGNNSFTEQEMEETKNNMLSIQKSLGQKNIEFCLLVPPNKEEVYSQYMPITSLMAPQSRTDKLLELLSANGINSVNPKDDLLLFDQKYRTYYKNDTHWNELGAYIGTRSVMESFGLDLPELSDDRIIQGKYAPSDLANMAGLKNIFEPDYGYTVVDAETDNTSIGGEMVHFYNENARFDKTVFLVGDSFRVAMVPTLRTAFRDVYVVHRSAYSVDAMIDAHSDYVILEFVERYSSQIADFNLL